MLMPKLSLSDSYADIFLRFKKKWREVCMLLSRHFTSLLVEREVNVENTSSERTDRESDHRREGKNDYGGVLQDERGG